MVGVNDCVGVKVIVGVRVAVAVDVAVAVWVGVGVKVAVDVDVWVTVGLAVAVWVGVWVAVEVGVTGRKGKKPRMFSAFIPGNSIIPAPADPTHNTLNKSNTNPTSTTIFQGSRDDFSSLLEAGS